MGYVFFILLSLPPSLCARCLKFLLPYIFRYPKNNYETKSSITITWLHCDWFFISNLIYIALQAISIDWMPKWCRFLSFFFRRMRYFDCGSFFITYGKRSIRIINYVSTWIMQPKTPFCVLLPRHHLPRHHIKHLIRHRRVPPTSIPLPLPLLLLLPKTQRHLTPYLHFRLYHNLTIILQLNGQGCRFKVRCVVANGELADLF